MEHEWTGELLHHLFSFISALFSKADPLTSGPLIHPDFSALYNAII